MKKTYNNPNHGGQKQLPSFPCVSKWRTWVYGKMGMHFWVLSYSKVKIDFPQIRISFPYSSHPHAITNSTTFWKNLMIREKDKMVSWGFDGFSLWHLDFPHWTKGLNTFPPHSLGKSCPHLIICCIDIAGWGFLQCSTKFLGRGGVGAGKRTLGMCRDTTKLWGILEDRGARRRRGP